MSAGARMLEALELGLEASVSFLAWVLGDQRELQALSLWAISLVPKELILKEIFVCSCE